MERQQIGGREILSLMLLLLLILAGCGSQGNLQSEEMAGEASPRDAMDNADDMAKETDAFEVSYDGSAVVQETEPLIIFTGHLRLLVADAEEAVAEINALVARQDGYVVSSNLFQRDEERYGGEVTVRVPSARFVETMSALQDLAVEVESASQSSEDVTEEYVDLQARLRNLEATADRVRGFLDEADNVEEALAVNAELSRLESDIEAYKGRIQYLRDRADFSTITIVLEPDQLARPIEVGGWRPRGIALDAIETLLGALQGLASIVIWLVLFILPLGLLLLIPVYLVYRLWRRRGAAVVEAD